MQDLLVINTVSILAIIKSKDCFALKMVFQNLPNSYKELEILHYAKFFSFKLLSYHIFGTMTDRTILNCIYFQTVLVQAKYFLRKCNYLQ